ncbi:hypothetical protein ONA92_18265 [Mycobacteroides salmoniphilum]|uniref:hypothetical protein n=1 Tax=Mycobacteroides salmoniphilum TaxID=404941 RepID=UPI00356B5B3A
MSNYVSFGYLSLSGGKTISVGVIADKGVVQVNTNGGREIGALTPGEAAELADKVAHAASAAPTIFAAYGEYQAAAIRAADAFSEATKSVTSAANRTP